MKLLPVNSAESVLGYRYRLGKKNYPNLIKKIVTEPLTKLTCGMWLKLLCNGRMIREQKDLGKFFKRIIRVSNNHVNSVKLGGKIKYLVVKSDSIPRIINWGLRFVDHLDDCNISSLSNCLLRLKIFDENIYQFAAKHALNSASNMEYNRLLFISLSLSKLYSIHNSYGTDYLYSLVISAAERLAKEEITGNQLGLLCQSLYYCKLFSNDIMQLILPAGDHFLNNNGLSPENINSIYGYISLYPQSYRFLLNPMAIFCEYISKSLVDAKNILRFLKINHVKNNKLVKRISTGVLAASVDELTSEECLDLMKLYVQRDIYSLPIVTSLISRMDWLIESLKLQLLTGLMYYICKIYVSGIGDYETVVFKRHLQLSVSRAVSNCHANKLDAFAIVRCIGVLKRVGGDSGFVFRANAAITSLIKPNKTL